MAISSPLQSKVSTNSARTVKKFQSILLNRTRVRKEIFQKKTILQNRRIENERRKQREDELEAPNLVIRPREPAQLIAGSAKGFFERLVGFLGYLTAGWIINNLPTWIAMGKEFIARTQQMGKILGNFIVNTTDVFKDFTKLLGATLNNLMKFDFLDTSGQIKTAFDDLTLSVDNWGTEFEDAIKLLTTPLSEGIASGENAPATGTQITDEGAYEPSAPYSGSGGQETSGGFVSPQAVYSYLKSKGMSDNHALGITANIKGESDFEIGVGEKENSRSGVGLFQYSNVRKPAFLRAVPDYKTNWKGQIDYAIGEGVSPQYFKTQFSSPEESAYWWMHNWERPDARVYRERNKKHNDFIKSFKPGSSQSPAPQQSTPGTGQSFRPLPQGSFKGGENQKYLDSRDGGSRRHLGIDITESNWKRGSDPKIPVVAIRGGVVSQKYYVGGSQYDSGLMIDQDDGYSVRYLHMSPSVRPGQKVSAGQRIGRLVDLGDQTHLHIELFSGSKRLDPTNYVKTVEKGGIPPSIARQQPPTPVPAQITPTGTSQKPQMSQSLAQERTGPTVIVSQNPSSPPQQMMYSGGGSSGGGSSQISEFTLLNNFIKNKLLLDLAYL